MRYKLIFPILCSFVVGSCRDSEPLGGKSEWSALYSVALGGGTTTWHMGRLSLVNADGCNVLKVKDSKTDVVILLNGIYEPKLKVMPNDAKVSFTKSELEELKRTVDVEASILTTLENGIK